MWGVNYQTLLLMLVDAPRYVSGEEAKKQKGEKKKITGFFQSKNQVK